jgi:OOP family OmpA-OmpF porin
MSFETWTKSIGLLGHAGVGLSFLERKDPAYAKDRMGNLMAGITGQIKLSNRVALTGDFTTIIHGRQKSCF